MSTRVCGDPFGLSCIFQLGSPSETNRRARRRYFSILLLRPKQKLTLTKSSSVRKKIIVQSVLDIASKRLALHRSASKGTFRYLYLNRHTDRSCVLGKHDSNINGSKRLIRSIIVAEMITKKRRHGLHENVYSRVSSRAKRAEKGLTSLYRAVQNDLFQTFMGNAPPSRSIAFSIAHINTSGSKCAARASSRGTYRHDCSVHSTIVSALSSRRSARRHPHNRLRQA